MSISGTPATLSEVVNSSSLICCCSKSNVEIATGAVQINTLIPGDPSDRLIRRFKEIYHAAVHQNVSFDNKTWSEAAEEGNCTLDFDHVNVARKTDMDNSILLLDNLIVETTCKRRVFPIQISQILSKELKLQRKANTSLPRNCQSNDTTINRLNVSEEYLSLCRGKLKECFLSFSAVSKKLPYLENKTTRLEDVSKQSISMKNNLTTRILQNSLTDDTRIVASLTPMKRRYEELVCSTAPVSLSKKTVSSKKLCIHQSSRYQLRSTTFQ